MTETAAKKAAVPVLKALGQDDAKLDASELMGAVRVVNADPKVGACPRTAGRPASRSARTARWWAATAS